jgi:anti-anti-sigma factor
VTISDEERQMTHAGDTTGSHLEVLEPRPGIAVLVLHGEHDLATKEELHLAITSLIDTHDVVIADLSTVLFIDSSTLGVLVRGDRAAHASGKVLRLQLGTKPIVERILEISGLLKAMDCYPTRDEAFEGRRATDDG